MPVVRTNWNSVFLCRSSIRSRIQTLLAVEHGHDAAGSAAIGLLDYVWAIESQDGHRTVEIKQEGVNDGNKVVQVVFDFDRQCVSFEQIEGGLYFDEPHGWIAAPLRWIIGGDHHSQSQMRLKLRVMNNDGQGEREVLTRVWPLVEVDDLSALHPSVAPEDDLSAIQDRPLADDSSAADIEPAAASMQERKQQTNSKDHEAQPHPVVKSEFKNDSIIAESIAVPHIQADAASLYEDDALHAKVELELSERADHDAAIETKFEESRPKQAVKSSELSHLIHSITPRPLVGSEEKEDIDAPYQPSFGRVLAGVSLVGMLAPAGSILLGVMARNLMA